MHARFLICSVIVHSPLITHLTLLLQLCEGHPPQLGHINVR